MNKANEEGKTAFQQGKPITANPYEHLTLAWTQWQHGWTADARQKKQAEASNRKPDNHPLLSESSGIKQRGKSTLA